MRSAHEDAQPQDYSAPTRAEAERDADRPSITRPLPIDPFEFDPTRGHGCGDPTVN